MLQGPQTPAQLEMLLEISRGHIKYSEAQEQYNGEWRRYLLYTGGDNIWNLRYIGQDRNPTLSAQDRDVLEQLFELGLLENLLDEDLRPKLTQQAMEFYGIHSTSST